MQDLDKHLQAELDKDFPGLGLKHGNGSQGTAFKQADAPDPYEAERKARVERGIAEIEASRAKNRPEVPPMQHSGINAEPQRSSGTLGLRPDGTGAALQREAYREGNYIGRLDDLSRQPPSKIQQASDALTRALILNAGIRRDQEALAKALGESARLIEQIREAL